MSQTKKSISPTPGSSGARERQEPALLCEWAMSARWSGFCSSSAVPARMALISCARAVVGRAARCFVGFSRAFLQSYVPCNACTASTMDSSARSTAANPFATRMCVAPAYLRLLSSNYRSSRLVRASPTIWEHGRDTGSEESRARVASRARGNGLQEVHKPFAQHASRDEDVPRMCRRC
jgi:hypothetical protein